MQSLVVKQPNGLFGMFYKYNCQYDIVNADAHSLSQVMVDEYGYDSIDTARNIIDAIGRCEDPYGDLTLTWEDTKRVVLEVHGKANWDSLLEDIECDMAKKIKVGNYLFIVSKNEDYGLPYGGVVLIESVEGNTVTLTRCLKTFFLTVSEVLDTSRFIMCIDQHIAGFNYTTKAPNEAGHYWFYGYPDNKDSLPSGIRLEMVHVCEIKTGLFQVYFSDDIRFTSHIEEKGIGLWAKAEYPHMPGL